MIRFSTNISKGDLILVSRWEQDEFDGVVGMIAKRDLFQKSATYGSFVGRPQGDGQCIVFNIDDFEPLGNFYELTGYSIFMGEGVAVAHEHLIVPDSCDWVIKDISVGYDSDR
tara:strand:- start:390 stop:728 length:339 start_codon:yes stop_codon:yes gene_type:complete